MAKCVPCLGPLVKKYIRENAPSVAEEMLAGVKDCDSFYGVRMCEVTASKGGRVKRAPSAYNIHTGECMRAGNTMKDCAAQWKKKKAAQ